jgi:hypothetical protein
MGLYIHCRPFGIPIAKHIIVLIINGRYKQVMFLISAFKVSNRSNAEDQKR